jgi:predicted Zn-dependent protease with MMP-like domain
MVEVDEERFEQLVADALDQLPPEVARGMDNVAVTVEDAGDDAGVLGDFDGVPVTARRALVGYIPRVAKMPARIILYRLPICARCDSADEVAALVGSTLRHELARYFGIPGDRPDGPGR